jgi:hypothetical protein
VPLARNDHKPWGRGVLVRRFNHRRKQKKGQKRGGKVVDLQTSMLLFTTVREGAK